MDLEEFKSAVDTWLDENEPALARTYEGVGTLNEQMAHLRKVLRLAFDAGFMRMGWPEHVGGLGGSNLLRAYLGEALTAREFVEPGVYSMPEVLAPTMINFAPEPLAAEMVPRLFRGDEIWSRGSRNPARAATSPRSCATPRGQTTVGE